MTLYCDKVDLTSAAYVDEILQREHLNESYLAVFSLVLFITDQMLHKASLTFLKSVSK